VIAVVILTFDVPDGMLEACVSSVVAAGGYERVIVVDNGRAASSRLAATALGDQVEVIVTGSNLGFAGGMNVGIDRALTHGATAVALLNDDATVSVGWLEPLAAELDVDERIGAVQPLLLFAGVPPTINSLGVELGRDGAGRDIGYGRLLPSGADGASSIAAHDIQIFTGGAVLLSRRFLADVGRFDERFFLYYEDVDLALRGGELGWRYRCVPASTVVHIGSVSTARSPQSTAFYRERNRLWVLLRHRPNGDIGRGLWLSVRRLWRAPRSVHARALAAGLAAAPRLVVARLRATRRP
jgi:GT2 family glycosyltransferase